MVALGDGKFCDTFVRQRIVIIADMNMTGINMIHWYVAINKAMISVK